MEFFTNIFTTGKWWPNNMKVLTFYVFVLLCVFASSVKCDEEAKSAKITIEYIGSKEITTTGTFGTKSRINKDLVGGRLVHVEDKTNQTDNGCGPIDESIIPQKLPWIAIVKRGICNFSTKIYYAGKMTNASAVVVYDLESKSSEDSINVMNTEPGKYDVSEVISVLIKYDDIRTIVNLLKNGEAINMTIEYQPDPKEATTPAGNQFNNSNTSVLFVSISFIVLIIISLAWLVFYYIQRCRYTNAKERLSRRLANAAKKAIAKIPQRSVKYGDKELDAEADQCAVCIEPYKVSDVIRVLPCKHVFHKSCVDPWLLDQRSCPMCKMDILRAYGMHLNGSQESVPQEAESGMLSSSPAIEDTEHSTSEDHGAVGGVKIVLYQHPALHYCESGAGGGYGDIEMSSEASLDLCSSPVAQCHVECTSQLLLENTTTLDGESGIITDNEMPSIARSASLDSVHMSDDECNEVQSLISGRPSRVGSMEGSLMGSISLRRDSEHSGHNSITHSIKDMTEH